MNGDENTTLVNVQVWYFTWYKLGLNVLGKRGFHELGGAESVAVYGVAVLAEGVHTLAVTDDLL